MATNYNKLMNNLEMLKLDKIREYLDSYISLVNEGQKDIVDAFYELTSFEMDLRNERAMNACVKVANFPISKHSKILTSHISHLSIKMKS